MTVVINTQPQVSIQGNTAMMQQPQQVNEQQITEEQLYKTPDAFAKFVSIVRDEEPDLYLSFKTGGVSANDFIWAVSKTFKVIETPTDDQTYIRRYANYFISNGLVTKPKKRK